MRGRRSRRRRRAAATCDRSAVRSRRSRGVRALEQTREPDACLALANAYRNGKGVARDAARAAEVLRSACYSFIRVRGLGPICAELAEMVDAGEGVAQDPAHATELYAVACAI